MHNGNGLLLFSDLLLLRFYLAMITLTSIHCYSDLLLQPTMKYGNPCLAAVPPYISRCNYDAAYELLQHIYGDLTVIYIMSFHSIHNVVDRSVLQAMWEELAGEVGHRDQLIIC